VTQKAPAKAPDPTPIGEKEIEKALKDYLKPNPSESAAVKKLRLESLIGQQISFKGKLGREDAKSKKIEIDVVDDTPARTIVITKTRDSLTGVKMGKDITVIGTIAGVTVKTDISTLDAKGNTIRLPPRIDITVK